MSLESQDSILVAAAWKWNTLPRTLPLLRFGCCFCCWCCCCFEKRFCNLRFPVPLKGLLYQNCVKHLPSFWFAFLMWCSLCSAICKLGEALPQHPVVVVRNMCPNEIYNYATMPIKVASTWTLFADIPRPKTQFEMHIELTILNEERKLHWLSSSTHHKIIPIQQIGWKNAKITLKCVRI